MGAVLARAGTALMGLFARLGLTASTPPGLEYHGFISYSHSADGELGPALQRALQRFAKPWHQARALHIFRDEVSMAASASLWNTIEQALDGSAYYILLASPAAATSEWVNREAERWRATKPIENLLIALTAGELAWDERAGDFDWQRTTALPRALERAFSGEPRFVDMRWARDAGELSLENGRFSDAVADLAAPLHGRPKDELAGEEVLQQRRAVRLRRAVAAVLVGITLLAVAAGVIALVQRDNAINATHAAQSQLLASIALRTPDLQQSSLLALEAYRTAPTLQARSAVLHVGQSHQLGMPYASGRPLARAALSPNGRLLATAALDGGVAVYGVPSHRVLWSVAPSASHSGGVGAVAFSRDGTRFAYAQRGGASAVVVAVAGWRTLREWPAMGGVSDLAFSQNGSLLAAAGDRVVRVWTVRGGGAPTALRGHSGPVHDVTFSADGRLLASSSCDVLRHRDFGDHTGLIWDVHSGRVVARLQGQHPLCGIAVDHGGRLAATAADDGVATLWDVGRQTPAGLPFISHSDALSDVALSPDGKLLASASRDRSVRIADLASRREAYAPLTHTRAATSVAFSADGKLLVSAGLDGARLWSVIEPTEAGELAAGTPNARRIAFSAAGRTLMWSDPRTGATWTATLASRRVRGPVPGTPARGAAAVPVALSPDRRIRATVGRDETIRLRSAKSGRELGSPLVGHTGAIYGLAFSADGRTLASASADGFIRLWDVPERHALLTLPGHYGYAYAVAFSPDGTVLASTGSDAVVRLWSGFSVGASVARLCGYFDHASASAIWSGLDTGISYKRAC